MNPLPWKLRLCWCGFGCGTCPGVWAAWGGEWHLEAGPGHLDSKELLGQSQKEWAGAGLPGHMRLGPGVCVCVCLCVCVYGTSAQRGQAGGNWVSLQSFQHKGNPLLCFLFFFLLDIPLLLIGGSLLCSVVSVSAVQPHASAMHIHTSPYPWTSLPPRSHPLGHHRAPR